MKFELESLAITNLDAVERADCLQDTADDGNDTACGDTDECGCSVCTAYTAGGCGDPSEIPVGEAPESVLLELELEELKELICA